VLEQMSWWKVEMFYGFPKRKYVYQLGAACIIIKLVTSPNYSTTTEQKTLDELITSFICRFVLSAVARHHHEHALSKP